MPSLRLVNTPTRRPIIELRINGRMYRFLIDTGATHTVLDPSLIPELNKEQEASRRVRRCYTVDNTTQGESIAVCFRFVGVVVREIMIHPAIAEHYDKTSGLIGQDILQQFKSVTFDNVRHTVRFEV